MDGRAFCFGISHVHFFQFIMETKETAESDPIGKRTIRKRGM